MGKLTKLQLTLLKRAADASCNDNSGQGTFALDGYEARSFNILSRRGLVSLAIGFPYLSYGVKITDAGRAALKETVG